MIRRVVVAGVAVTMFGTMLGGCVAELAYDAVTLPIRVVGSGINAVVPSQKKADRNRGRRERKAEERQQKIDERQRKTDEHDRKAAKKAAEEQERAARSGR